MRVSVDLQPELGLSVTEAARRAQIVSTTIATIAELGYRKATFARIKERAGLSSTRIIGYHFGTKAGLIQAVVTTVLGIKEKFLLERAAGTTDRAEMLRAHIETEVAFLRDCPECVRVLREVTANAGDPDGWHPAGPMLKDLQAGQFERLLRQGQQEGAFGTFSPPVMARTIAQAIDGAAEAYAADPSLDLDAYAAELVTLFVRATAR
ncbi:AcrR family transcriptional regulator [Amycolatopsis bartoniae]|uniref:TetR family transcriptional regulator n=1 Tax=Amycolatopsis bartoniae TaxID=941986 RepID=A0A8H9IT83_9PSEU|nr:TetR/AcrR family transcriptional regulator [Amycolatopsis bartoniae]MBB2935650.1 AcrR family transcriptional regulator [Amycolatopsis bartoniae]TVT02095.1 TetR family transcriptional regulator [Amycolatopsis bartoniae]GHF60865.1 TetR family transcriptional regulator [Amycolatopsis bartoniae]